MPLRTGPPRSASPRISAASPARTTHVGDTRTDLIAELQALATAVNDGLTYDIVVALIQHSGADDDLGGLNARMSRIARCGVWRIVRDATARHELQPGIDETDFAAQLVGPLAYRRLLMAECIESSHIERTVEAFLTYSRNVPQGPGGASAP